MCIYTASTLRLHCMYTASCGLAAHAGGTPNTVRLRNCPSATSRPCLHSAPLRHRPHRPHHPTAPTAPTTPPPPPPQVSAVDVLYVIDAEPQSCRSRVVQWWRCDNRPLKRYARRAARVHVPPEGGGAGSPDGDTAVDE